MCQQSGCLLLWNGRVSVIIWHLTLIGDLCRATSEAYVGGLFKPGLYSFVNVTPVMGLFRSDRQAA